MAEAPTPPPSPAAAHGDSKKKRPLELGRPEFMAGEDGAYHVLEMPKKNRCGYASVVHRRRRRHRARSHFLTINDDDVNNSAANLHGGFNNKKRALELDEDDEPELVADKESGGAYEVWDMPKKYKCDYMTDPDRMSSPLISALDAREALSLASFFRTMSVTDKYIQELKAKAAAQRATTHHSA